MADNPANFKIVNYELHLFHALPCGGDPDNPEFARALIKCFGDGDEQLSVYFLDDGTRLPKPSGMMKDREVKPIPICAIYAHISMLSSWVDMLRNEKPLYGHLVFDTPMNFETIALKFLPEYRMGISTKKEPVGVGEKLYDHL